MDLQNIKVGMVVSIRLTSGSLVSGIVAVKNNIEFKDKEVVVFRLQLTEGQFIDISEYDINCIKVFDDLCRIEYFKEEIEKKHDIKCFDSDNKKLSNSVIMGNMLDHNKWDDLTEEEKRVFVENICFSEDDIVEILNVLFDYRHENQKLHDKRLKALEKATKSIEIYHNFLEKIPYANIICNFMYEQMKIEDLVNSI